MKFSDYMKEEKDVDILRDAGFLENEIRMGVGDEELQKAKQGYIFFRGDFKPITPKMVADKTRVMKKEFKEAQEILKKIKAFKGENIGSGEMVDITQTGDSWGMRKSDAIRKWEQIAKDKIDTIERWNRQLKRARSSK